ncbi:MAG: AAA family ATPase [Microscillaceae bacterium]|nr:AAA family ATPase [Microscillaceae bacterium]
MVEDKEISQEDRIRINATSLDNEINWFASVVNAHLAKFSLQQNTNAQNQAINPQNQGENQEENSVNQRENRENAINQVENQDNQEKSVDEQEKTNEPKVNQETNTIAETQATSSERKNIWNRLFAPSAKRELDKIKKEAEQAKKQVEETKKEAQQAKVEAEQAKKQVEETKKNAEEAKMKVEQIKRQMEEMLNPPKKFLDMPDLSQDTSMYAQFVNYYKMNEEQRLVLILALIPYLHPEMLDVFFMLNPSTGRGYTEFGGLKGTRHGGFLPTIETALFVLAGADLEKRIEFQTFFEPEHFFIAHNILQISRPQEGEPHYSSLLSMDKDFVDLFTIGTHQKPQFGTDFPAKLLETSMDWDDLILDDYTKQQLEEISIWLEFHLQLMQDSKMKKMVKPGYKALFYGPPGTGKTLAASILGKKHKKDVYRIDLSRTISKYIGETEKNLEKIFHKAENKNWILFFDEADALFGKRTNNTDAHDRYANQEVSYLLQRLEDYPGLVILASNMKQNMDEAFTRRLQSIIHFAKPQYRERKAIWNNCLSKDLILKREDTIDLDEIARQYELTGGNIVNVVQYAYLKALSTPEKMIKKEYLIEGIRKEFLKEGKTL